MSHPNPRRARRRYFGRHALKYEICFGSPSEVVEAVNDHLESEEGWNLHGETEYYFAEGRAYAIQALVLWGRPKDDTLDEDEETRQVEQPKEKLQ